MVPEGDVSPSRANRYTLPPPLDFLHRQIRPNRSIVLNFGIIPDSFGLSYTLIDFWGI